MILALNGRLKELFDMYMKSLYRGTSGIRTHDLCDAGAAFLQTDLWSHTVESTSICWAHVFAKGMTNDRNVWWSAAWEIKWGDDRYNWWLNMSPTNWPALNSSFHFQHHTLTNISFIWHSFRGKHEAKKLICSQLCGFIAQMVKALHRHRRGRGFKSP